MNPSCGQCHYFELAFEERGFCHRGPPKPTDGWAEFPLIRTTEWCGEFKSQAEWKAAEEAWKKDRKATSEAWCSPINNLKT